MDVIVKPGLYDDDDWIPGAGSIGSAHSISDHTAEEDVIARLHQVVEEVTGQPVPRPAKKIGFY